MPPVLDEDPPQLGEDPSSSLRGHLDGDFGDCGTDFEDDDDHRAPLVCPDFAETGPHSGSLEQEGVWSQSARRKIQRSTKRSR